MACFGRVHAKITKANMRKKCAWDQVPVMKREASKIWLSQKFKYIIFYWLSLIGTDSKTNKQKTHFNQRLLFSWNINFQTSKVHSCFFCAVGIILPLRL